MKPTNAVAAILLLITGCSIPYRLVYSSGFSFGSYDYLIIGKPDGPSTGTTLYGMDIEFGNLMARYNMNVVGDKEYASFPLEQQRRTLFVRMSLIATGTKQNLVTISFDDAATGKTVASLTAKAKGDMFDPEDRTEAIESLSSAIVQALERDKGISVSDENAKRVELSPQ
jgi:hypothetical protein